MLPRPCTTAPGRVARSRLKRSAVGLRALPPSVAALHAQLAEPRRGSPKGMRVARGRAARAACGTPRMAA